jgi:hypothetical protein
MVMMCHIPFLEAPLMGMQLPYMLTPWSQVSDCVIQLGTYFWDRRERGVKDAQNMFSTENKLCLTNYIHIFMQKQLICECP